ncbi:molybdenum cofactor guanylyltransferase [Methylophaga sp. SB9B]|uniref:molybdenum cofactor guanylyltransferase MobA n=1 Tax=Methylophaga sp. SB9B TaxID=2570356 RepID=UPI0010A8AED3|nr:molybdenum cofactor guanylyltransferase MobA [Methylophaga sp. SB9B]THK43249.1 molybdenum cofactor guanylyltransferase [Methylophaga sp. SB9B]
MTNFSYPTVTGVILAGGEARRMGGQDKGLIAFANQPLVAHVINHIAPQVEQLLINANRNIERYQQFGYPVIRDSLSDFQGPLAGMLAGMLAAKTDYILTVPCDSPAPSKKLRQRMLECLLLSGKKIAVATDGKRIQPVFALIHCELADDLHKYLAAGERKIDRWFAQHPMIEVDFSDQPESFKNLNHPEDLLTSAYNMPVPMLGIAAYSGTGKTTLLTQLIPRLRESGLNVAVVKHAHHLFDIDQPGKDSYRIREAGASQVLVASRRLLALMQTSDNEQAEPQLTDCLARLDMQKLDLILVEGFKHEAFPKLELHRSNIGKPLIYPNDPNIIGIATDSVLSDQPNIPVLNLNDLAAILQFITTFIRQYHHD